MKNQRVEGGRTLSYPAWCLSAIFQVLLVGALGGCATGEGGTTVGGGGEACDSNADCASGSCVAGQCVGVDVGLIDSGIDAVEDTVQAFDTGGDVGNDGSSDVEDVAADVDAGCDGELGCPCEEDVECLSDFCVPADEGNVCASFCDDECPEGYECRTLQNSGSDVVRLCVPIREYLCTSCRDDFDCGGIADWCLDYADGQACGQSCEDEGCPLGFVCESVVRDDGETSDQCVREVGTCSSCYDADGDGYGEGPDCLGADCAPQDDEIYPGAPEVCDGADNDCDGTVDNGFDLDGDVTNCGECGLTCSAARATPFCDEGVCAIESCEAGYVDLDGEFDTGCEFVCTPSGVEVCDGIDNDCDGFMDEDFNLVTDVTNCGGCGVVCDLNEADSICVDGDCVVDVCRGAWLDCNGLDEDGCERNTEVDLSHCGGCDSPCGFANATASCDLGECNFTACEEGWVDLNTDLDDGCEYECTPSGDGSDAPDVSGNDADCDGIDGEIESSIFVATPANGGSDTNDGRSPGAPVATLDQGIALAAACPGAPCDVLVSSGVYTGSIIMQSGVDVYGGYSPDTWGRRITANLTEIVGTDTNAVTFDGITTATALDGFTVRGTDFTAPRMSTYGVVVVNSGTDNVHLANLEVRAGDAGPGINGTDGVDGSAGETGRSTSNSSGGSARTSSCGAVGGGGGSAWDCGNSGGSGGSAGSDPSSGGGAGGSGANRCGSCDDVGGNGTNGGDGGAGAQGSGGTASADADGEFDGAGNWRGTDSSAGARGLNGTGGGGGGAGGTDEDPWYCVFWSGTDLGGGGGAGGGGGCGGQPGLPGQPGGGSFGIIVNNSAIVVEAVDIIRGAGGDGGNGGAGGDGGNGAPGGTGHSPPTDEAGVGGRGGQGGNGGGGGGGAGACGGPAIGIALVGGGAINDLGTTFGGGTPGSGGSGGLGGARGAGGARASSGATGCVGRVADVVTY